MPVPLFRRAVGLAATTLVCLSLAVSGSLASGAQAASAPIPPVPGVPGASSDHEIFTTYVVDPKTDPLHALTSFARIMATPSIDTGWVPKVDAPLNDPARACPPARCRDFRVPTPKSVKVTTSMTRVILPVGYYSHPRKHYPTVYLYNGAASSYNGWSRKTLLTQISRKYQAIFVMPEGGYEKQLGMFSDWKNGQYDWETFHVHVVIPWVDKTFRTIPGDRAAVGVSVSTLGALGYAARHHGLFKAVLSISGLVEEYQLTTNALPPGLASVASSFPVDLDKIWGDPIDDASTWNAHDPSKPKFVAQLKGVKLFITAGSGFYTGSQADPIHSGFLEQTLFQGERFFLEALDQGGIPYQARISQGNVHDWPYFDHPLRWGLAGIMKALTPAH